MRRPLCPESSAATSKDAAVYHATGCTPRSERLAFLEVPCACLASPVTAGSTAVCVPAHSPSFGSHRRRSGLLHARNFWLSPLPILPQRNLHSPLHPLPRFGHPWSPQLAKPFPGSGNKRTRYFVSAHE